MTVDLRGLAPAVKAHASARNMTLAAFARAAMVDALKHAEANPFHLSHDGGPDDGPPVKLTLNLPMRQASWLVEHARAAGLSYGSYLASVIDGAPAPGGLGDAARALTASTAQLAALSTDLNNVVRLLRQGRSAEAKKHRQRLVSMFDEVRKHMRLDAALAAEVRTAIRWNGQDPIRLEEGETSMSAPSAVDAALVEWGERLFYPRNRIVRSTETPRLSALSVGHRAAVVRAHLEATVLRRAPQVMVRITGGGRGMAAIAAHFRYIAKAGRLPFEDDRAVTREGKEALSDLVEQWRYGGSEIPTTSPRREAFNIILSMPRGTDPLTVQRAAREFAKAEFVDHRYVMVLHAHQANPHVHLSVRAESNLGDRLNPRKADLQRWRETFAERLRAWGIDAEASRQATRGERHSYEPIWRVKARRRDDCGPARPPRR